jgi:hypothetical protein
MRRWLRIRSSWLIAAVTGAAVGALVVAIAVATGAIGSPNGSAESGDESRQLRRIETARLRALVDKDMRTADALHASGFQVVPPQGIPLTREEYLGRVKSDDIDYIVFEPTSKIEVRVSGDAAVMWYMSNIDVSVAGGARRVSHAAWHTSYYERSEGRWQAVWEQATAIGGFPPQD